MFTKVEFDTESMLSDSTVTEANMHSAWGSSSNAATTFSSSRGNPAEGTGEPPAERRKAGQARRLEQAVLNVLGAGPTPMGQDLIHVNPPKLGLQL